MGSTADAAASVRGATEYAERQYAYMSPGERYERVRRTRAGNARDLLGDIGATLADGTDQDVVGGEDVPTGGQYPLVSEDGHCGVCGFYFYRRFLWRCGHCSLVMCVPRQCASNHVRRCPPGTRFSLTHTCVDCGPCAQDANLGMAHYEDVSDELKGQEDKVNLKEDEGVSNLNFPVMTVLPMGLSRSVHRAQLAHRFLMDQDVVDDEEARLEDVYDESKGQEDKVGLKKDEGAWTPGESAPASPCGFFRSCGKASGSYALDPELSKWVVAKVGQVSATLTETSKATEGAPLSRKGTRDV